MTKTSVSLNSSSLDTSAKLVGRIHHTAEDAFPRASTHRSELHPMPRKQESKHKLVKTWSLVPVPGLIINSLWHPPLGLDGKSNSAWEDNWISGMLVTVAISAMMWEQRKRRGHQKGPNLNADANLTKLFRYIQMESRCSSPCFANMTYSTHAFAVLMLPSAVSSVLILSWCIFQCECLEMFEFSCCVPSLSSSATSLCLLL